MSKASDDKRKELADFLRTRRERIKPNLEKGAPLSRRRTPGLRREEVAELAGVGATWYTWLEQARDIQPSSEVLERIGKALELNPFEIKHLFHLAGKVAPEMGTEEKEQVPHTLKKMIDQTLNVPAFVLGEHFDILHLNGAMQNFLSDLDHKDGNQINWMEFMFNSPTTRERVVDWESHATRTIAEFRAAVSELAGSPSVIGLIDRLIQTSPRFAEGWKSHDVRERVSLKFQIKHPKRGILEFERSIYSPVDFPKLKLVVFTPL